ncbi:MAG TPA: EF-hand domain-containing protein [Luteimonas sp.]|nr:EF-hand domain-containing protein [Luteimonas sp.]
MNRIALLTLALAAAAISAVAVAQQANAPTHHTRVDANSDGVIDRAEAAAHPRLGARFDQLDKNHDGRLAADERPQRHGRRGGPHGSGGIAGLDANGDGRIGRDEMVGKEKLVAKFAEIDANHDGYLVRSELRAHHERMRPQRKAEHVKRSDQHFTTADLNRDGKLSRVEVNEKMPRLAKSFAWMDENRDGFLSREELRPSRH